MSEVSGVGPGQSWKPGAQCTYSMSGTQLHEALRCFAWSTLLGIVSWSWDLNPHTANVGYVYLTSTATRPNDHPLQSTMFTSIIAVPERFLPRKCPTYLWGAAIDFNFFFFWWSFWGKEIQDKFSVLHQKSKAVIFPEFNFGSLNVYMPQPNTCLLFFRQSCRMSFFFLPFWPLLDPPLASECHLGDGKPFIPSNYL